MKVLQSEGVASQRFGLALLSRSANGWRVVAAPSVSPLAAKGSMINAPLRVGGQVKAPIVISRVDPQYPAIARENKIEGIVIVEAIVDREGRVRDVRVLKPLPFGLDQAAVDAVQQWIFKPATYQGQPVDVILNLTVSFSHE
jgi:protein TonB